MKKTELSRLPVIPEKYGVPSSLDSDMTKDEQMFVSGLIKYYEPKTSSR